MKVIVLGATGMIGHGVLRECLRDTDVDEVLVIGRTPTGQRHPKLREIHHPDLMDLQPIEGELGGYDPCFFCLGVSSAGMKEKEYRRVTYDLTMSVARTLARLSPDLTFVYVSGMGTDSTGRGRTMWARVKGETENALLALPPRAYMLRPGFIQPLHGARSKTRLYAAIYAVTSPLYSVLRRLLPGMVTTTEQLGRAMLTIAKAGASKRILETRDINAVAG
jgi:uncharacterized protein YbjT (DUF2867 family)